MLPTIAHSFQLPSFPAPSSALVVAALGLRQKNRLHPPPRTGVGMLYVGGQVIHCVLHIVRRPTTTYSTLMSYELVCLPAHVPAHLPTESQGDEIVWTPDFGLGTLDWIASSQQLRPTLRPRRPIRPARWALTRTAGASSSCAPRGPVPVPVLGFFLVFFFSSLTVIIPVPVT